MSEPGEPNKANPFALAIATALVMLHTRRYRRNLLFVLTLAMLIMVFVGAVPLGEVLTGRPMLFTVYWAVCFVLLMAVLALALYDLMRVRREGRRAMRKLDDRLNEAVDELRAEADLRESDEADGDASDESPEKEPEEKP